MFYQNRHNLAHILVTFLQICHNQQIQVRQSFLWTHLRFVGLNKKIGAKGRFEPRPYTEARYSTAASLHLHQLKHFDFE